MSLDKTVIILFGSKAKEFGLEIAYFRFLKPLVVASLRSKMKLNQFLTFFFLFFIYRYSFFSIKSVIFFF